MDVHLLNMFEHHLFATVSSFDTLWRISTVTVADVDVLRCVGSFNESTWPTQTLRKPTWTEWEDKKNKKWKSKTHWKGTLRILCLKRCHMGSWIRLITLKKNRKLWVKSWFVWSFPSCVCVYHKLTNWDAPYLPDSSLVGRSGCCQCVCEPWPSTVQHIVATVPLFAQLWRRFLPSKFWRSGTPACLGRLSGLRPKEIADEKPSSYHAKPHQLY